MTTEQTPTAAEKPRMTRAALAEQVAFYRALAEQAKIKADQYEANFTSAIGDEYREQGTAPTWRVKELVTISGRVANAHAAITDSDDFLAWVKAHRPDDVETIERVKPLVQSAILKGCRPSPDGAVVITAGGDEIAGVEYRPGGTFQGVSFKFETSAKEAYAELARTTLDAVALRPAEPEQPIEAAPMPEPPMPDNPWSAAPANPWDAPAAVDNPWASNS